MWGKSLYRQWEQDIQGPWGRTVPCMFAELQGGQGGCSDISKGKGVESMVRDVMGPGVQLL